MANRPFVKEWTLDELVVTVSPRPQGTRLRPGPPAVRRHALLRLPSLCQRRGGLGPDLSGVAGRFSARDLLESIVLPSKVISDQYEAVTIQTTDGRVVTGRIVNLNGDSISISPNMFDPNRQIASSAARSRRSRRRRSR